jgi:hypothetical protein
VRLMLQFALALMLVSVLVTAWLLRTSLHARTKKLSQYFQLVLTPKNGSCLPKPNL